jgi:peroxiredoxin
MPLRSSRFLSIAALAVAALLVVLLALQNRALREEALTLRMRETLPYPGHFVPTFQATTVAGKSVTIGATESGQRQVLFVFRTTCRHSLETLPAWRAIAEGLEAALTDVGVYGISLDSESETLGYVAGNDISFPVVRFPDPKLRRLYRVGAVPMTLVLNHEGEAIHARVGVLKSPGAVDSIVVAAQQRARGVETEGDTFSASRALGQ